MCLLRSSILSLCSLCQINPSYPERTMLNHHRDEFRPYFASLRVLNFVALLLFKVLEYLLYEL
jgi:hypothetical protein